MGSSADVSRQKAAVAETTPELSRRSATRKAVLVVACCLLIWFARRPDQLLHPYVWDEESLVLRRFLDDGWFGALRPVQGFLILPLTLLLPLAAAISFVHLPVLAYWSATSVFVLTVWMLVVPDSRWGNQRTRILMAFATALCPVNPETIGVLLYSFWWCALWPVIVLGWKRDLWWARLPLLIVAALSSPAAALMSAPFVVSYWFTRRRADLVAAGILAVGLALQITSLTVSDRKGAVSMHLPLVLAQSERTVGIFVIWWTVPVKLDWWIGRLAGVVLFGALTMAAMYAVRRRHKVEPLLLLVVLGLLTGLSAAPAALMTNPHDAGPRYYLLPFVVLSWLLVCLWRESLLPPPTPVVAGALLVTSMLGISTTFARSASSTTGRLNWEQQIVECAASDARLVKVPVYFDGSAGNLWTLDMTPAECRVRRQ